MTGDGNQNNNSNTIFVHGLPYMILDSTRSKCFSVIAPHNQIIFVQYEAPGTSFRRSFAFPNCDQSNVT